MRKIFRKITSVVLGSTMLLSTSMLCQITTNAAVIEDSFAGTSSGVTGDCTWTLNNNGVLTIRGNGAMGNCDEFNSPWDRSEVQKVVIQEGVTGIGAYAFCSCTALTEITIPNSVASIGQGAFSYCAGLSEVALPEGITEIPNFTFRGCSGLTSFTIPESTIHIGVNTFDSCTGLDSIFIPKNVHWVDSSSFVSCNGLSSVKVDIRNPYLDSRDNCNAIIETESNMLYCGFDISVIPDTVTGIFHGAFSDCNRMSSLHIPKSVTQIYQDSFIDCFNLSRITVDNRNPKFDSRNNCNAIIETDTDTLVLGCDATVIPNTVTTLGDNSLKYCAQITSINIPGSVTSIGYDVFAKCFGLESIVIPASVTSIGYNLFDHCQNLSSIRVALGNPVYDSRNNCNAIIETASNKLCFGCNSTVIPGDIESIGIGAFRSKTGLTSVTVPEGVKTIEYDTFKGCNGLKEVNLPQSLEMIGESAFSDCINLSKIKIPNNVKTIREYAFLNCYSIKGKVLPDKVETVCYGAFENCNSITSIIVPKTLTEINNMAFSGCRSLINIWVDAANPVYDSRDNCNAVIYKNSNRLLFGCCNTYIPDTVTAIDNNAFYACRNLKSINIPASVTSIGYYAFNHCFDLTDVYYSGSQNQWNQIPAALDYYTNFSTNTSLDAATIHFNSQKNKTGDVNLDGRVNINDATYIQYYLASIRPLSNEQLELADIDFSEIVDIKDVTRMQKNLAYIL